MKRTFVWCAAVLLACAAVVQARAAETYELDPVHSALIFKIKHINVSYTYGRINNPTGTLVYDEADASKCSISMEVKTESVDTDNEKRDQHLKGPDFFNAKQFPTIAFKSTKVAKADDGTYDVTGNFTMLGVTKELTLKLTKTGGGKDPWGGLRVGFEGTFTIKRSDYGMKQALDAIGDDVTIIVAIEAAVPKKE
ncbi:MAG: YceI family protein [Planctomycetota bacterium]|nr:YceI family protein [Planctomycetota bacterium]